MQIERVEVMVVAPEVQRFTWSHDLDEQYMTNTIVRITTKDGHEGVGGVTNCTSYDFERYTCETLRHLIPAVIGRDATAREEIWQSLWPRVFPLPPQALSVIDIALWDLRGKAAGQPIYRLLGGAMDRIPAYASTPMLDDVPAYLRFIEEMMERGFRAVKFHCWCLPEKDLELARAARKEFGGDVAFMLDVENNYDLQSAKRVGAELHDLGFTWFEAPLFDHDLPGYRELTSTLQVPVLPSGNWLQDLTAFQSALETRCWTAARTDVTVAGGFTGGRKYLSAVEAAGMKCEIMSWFNTLVSCANLHLMLGTGLSTYFEQAVPWEPFEYGMHDVIRTGPDGHVAAPSGPGLGVEVDWDAMEAATIHRLDSRSML